MVHTLHNAWPPYPPLSSNPGKEFMRKHNASTEDYQEFLRAKTDFKKNNADYQGFIDGRDQGTTTYAEYQEYYRRKLNPQVLDLTGDDKPTIQNTSTPPQRRALPAPPSNHSKTSADTSRSSSMMRTAQQSGNSTPRASNGHSGTWDDPMVLESSDDDAPKQKTNPQISRQHGESGSGTPKKPPATTTSSKDTPKRPSYISPYDQNPKRTFSSSKDAEEPKSSQGSYTPRSSSFKQPPNPFQSPPPPDSKTAANERVVDKDPPSSLSSHFGARLQLSTPSQSGRQVVGPEASKTEGIKPSLSKDGTGQTGSKSIPPRDYLANPPHVKEGPASKIATAPNAKPSSPNKACGEQNAIESTTRRASATKPLLDKVYDKENKSITTPLFNGKDKEPDKLPDSSSKAQRLSIKPPKPLSHNLDNTSDRSQVKQTQDADERAQSKVQQTDRMELETAKFPASTDTPQASGGTDKQVVQLSTLLTKGAKETLADANLGTQQQMEPPRLKMETVAKNAFPLEVKQIETLLRKYVQECLEDQEEYVKFRFRKARLDQDETARRPKATQEKSERSLFADMPALEDHTHQTVGRKRFSIVWPTTSKTSDLSVPVMAYEPSTLMPPKYSNFVSLQSNVLSRNDTKLKYFPYFNDDFDGEKGDLYKELEERFKDQIKDRPLGRTRLEQAEMYGPYIEDFVKEVGTSLDDILFYLLDAANEPPSIEMSFAAMKSWMNRDVHCEGLFDRDAKKWTLVYSKIYQSKPDNYHLALAGLVCAAFMRVCGFSIWGLASRSPSANDISEKDQERLAGQSSGPSILDLRCTVCHVHNCPNHGAFVEHRSSGAEDDSSSEAETDSNEDAGHNHRQRAIHGQSKNPFSQRPAYQVGLPLAQYRGMDDNGTVTGDYTNPPIKFQSDEEEELCSSGCFWKKSNRKPMEANSEWSEKDVGNLKFALSAFINHPRGPCMIRHIVNTKPCWEIFNQMLALAPQHEENQKTPTRPKSRFQRKNPPKRKGSYWRKNSSTHNHELRKPFRPCNHDGSCEDANCRCFRENVTCEPSCTCPGSCERRFQGCGCERKGLMCWQNQDKCDCFQLNRECDPMLCKSCGVYEVLDPVNRHDNAILDGRCRNAAIQRGVPKRTLMGRSEVQGWGLFAGQDIEKDEFIGEYRGEVISRDESDRRGAVYHYRGLEYLFGVSETQDIDGTRAGSKMRFINHSAKNDNCWAKKMLCNTVQRIGLFAKTDIKAGEELFFNYGYPESVLKTFKERGDPRGDELNGDGVGTGAAQKNKQKAARKQGHVYKSEGGKKKGGKRGGSRRKRKLGAGNEWFVRPKSRVAKGKAKENEAVESTLGPDPTVPVSKGKQPETEELPPMPEESSDEDMYEPDEEDEEDSSEADSEAEPMDVDADDDESFSDAEKGEEAKTEEKIDRRRGGLVQKAGWETRKRKLAAGGSPVSPSMGRVIPKKVTNK